jgi:hypothetical protein
MNLKKGLIVFRLDGARADFPHPTFSGGAIAIATESAIGLIHYITQGKSVV